MSAGLFFLGTSTFSVYEELAQQLLTTPTATAAPSSHSFNPHSGPADADAISSSPQPQTSLKANEAEEPTSTTTLKTTRRRQEASRGWRSAGGSSRVVHCDLVLGDRFGIPYSTLRCAPLPKTTVFGGIRWVNYFQGSSDLTLKTRMARVLRDTDPQHATYLPESYILGGNVRQSMDEREAFFAAVQRAPSSTWILKPSAGAKGEGIQLVRGAGEASHMVDSLFPLPEANTETEALGETSQKEGEARENEHFDSTLGRVKEEQKGGEVFSVAKCPPHQTKTKGEGNGKGKCRYLAQRYLPRPLLLEGNRKFDIRIWVLLQSPYHIYVYSQGSCRTASVAYDPNNLNNRLAHLTNHCLQVGSEGYGAYESNNEMFFSDLSAYLEKKFYPTTFLKTEQGDPTGEGRGGGDHSVLSTRILPQLASIVVRTLFVMKPTLQLLPEDEASSFRCFQLFGYDLMVEDDLTVRLLEINGSPGIAQKYLSPLVADMASLLYRAHPQEDGSSSAPYTYPLSYLSAAHSSTTPASSCSSPQGLPRRTWDITRDEFVLLWCDGEDPIPEGLDHCAS